MNKMKKNFLMFVALVAATLGFTACSSDDGLASAEQGQEQERGVVKTQFTISIPQGTSGTTRMASGIVQATEALADFRGIKDIELYPFDTQVGVGSISGTTTIPSKILLAGGTSTNKKYGPSGKSDYTIDGKDNLFTNSKSHLYQDVDIPIGTRAFMFYGEAAGNAAERIQGKLNKTISGSTLGGIKFSHQQIKPDGNVGDHGITIAAYMTSIANAHTSAGKYWKDTKNVALRALYEEFTGENENGQLTNNGVKAGSWTNVRAAIQQLYSNLTIGDGDTDDTKNMKTAIKDAIKNKTTYGVHDDDGDGTLTFGTFREEIPGTDPKEYIEYSYPRDLGLPDGAAFVRWTPVADNPDTDEVELGHFDALANNSNTGTNIPSLDRYVYPPSLYYRVLSNIKTSTSIKGTSVTQPYNDDVYWGDILDYYNATSEEIAAGYNNTAVSSKTRSIVIKNPVQYSVGRLDATIVADATTIQDNAKKTNFDVGNSSTKFKVTGILIGGQKPVDYKFQQRSDATTFYTIYDNSFEHDTEIAPVYLRSSNNTPIYTLALETKSATGDNDENAIAKIAVEFENNSGQTLVGKDNELIPDGCRFYLIGTLDPNKNTTQKYVFPAADDPNKVDDPTNSSLSDPTLNNSDVIKKAFVQDYKTIVTLKVANLNNAYNTLPDLTLPQLEMGLSVDLGWQTGITQTINME